MSEEIARPDSASAKRFWIGWGAGLGLWVALLAQAAPYDLAISRAMTDRGSAFGQWVARFGEWPAWAVLLGLVSLSLVPRLRASPRLAALAPLTRAMVALALLHPLLITQALKHGWGRIRFRNLAPGSLDFSPFYHPTGPGTGESFPSGHVAMAFVLCLVPFYLARRGQRPWLAWLGVLIYGLIVVGGRILAGAHYLTDCLFSAGLSMLLAALLARWLVPGRPGAELSS